VIETWIQKRIRNKREQEGDYHHAPGKYGEETGTRSLQTYNTVGKSGHFRRRKLEKVKARIRGKRDLNRIESFGYK